MLYIEIPENMKFAVLDVKDSSLESKKEDHFVDAREDISATERLEPVSIQKAVKEFLRSHKQVGTYGGLTIHRKYKPSGKYLEYRTNDNGKFPTSHAIVTTRGTPPRVESGQRWFQSSDVYFSEKKLKLLREKSYEQKLNRQHYGPSPNPT